MNMMNELLVRDKNPRNEVINVNTEFINVNKLRIIVYMTCINDVILINVEITACDIATRGHMAY